MSDAQEDTLNRLLNETLTTTQLDFVWARLMFPTDAKAAAHAGIPKDTVYGWPKADRENIHTAVRLLKARGVLTAATILQRASVAAAVVKVAGLSERSKRLRQDAATEILDRTLGRPGQSIELSGKVQTENVTFDDSERVARLTALLDAARARRDGSPPGDDQPVAADSPPEPTGAGG